MRNLTREFYIPQNATKIEAVEGVTIYEFFNKVNNKPAAVCFVGKTIKPTWNYWFDDETKKASKIQKTIESFEAKKIAKTEAAILRKQQSAEAAKLVKVGDIFVESSHFESTIIDFWQVIAVKGTKVELMPISKSLVHTDSSGRNEDYMPDINSFTNNKIMKANVSPLLCDTIYLKCRSWYSISSWSGKPVYQTNAYWR